MALTQGAGYFSSKLFRSVENSVNFTLLGKKYKVSRALSWLFPFTENLRELVGSFQW